MARERSTSRTQEVEGRGPTSAPESRRREAPLGNQALLRALDQRSELAVAAPDHPGEREADVIAGQVVRSLLGGGPPATRPTQAGAAIQRKGEPGAAATTLRPAIAGEVAAGGGGRPLDRRLRGPLERAFGGADFGGVRIHDDARAHGLSRSLSARAFTHDRDIYFARGAFRPETRGGLHVLSHELAHVLQQGGRSRGMIHRYHAAVPASNTREDDVSFTVSGSNVFTHQVQGKHDFLTDDSIERAETAESERTALERPLRAKLATTAPENVALNISTGGHLAVESLGGDKQAKAYYTSTERLRTTNEALERVGSAFRMRAVSGHTVSVRTTGSRTLQKVEPENVDTTVSGVDMVTNQQCVDISRVVGGAHRMGKERRARVREAVDRVSPKLGGMRRLLASTDLGGVKEAKGKEYASLYDTLSILDKIKDTPEGVGFVPFAAKLKAVREAISSGKPASTEIQEFASDFLTFPEWSEVDELRSIHAAIPESQAKHLDGLFSDLLLVLQRFALYNSLKSGSAPELAESAGVNEEARPEIGDAYKISYLEFAEDKWNYHWAGVVARDGDDSVTLENYTRDNAKRIGKSADPRWYFQMYGVGKQSFHAFHTDKNEVTVTQAVRTEDSRGPSTPSTAVTTSKAIAEEIAKARFALINGSVGRKTNSDYLKCLRLLRECEAKAIEARHNRAAYRSILTLIPEIETAATAAKSTKWFGTGTKRNAALTELKAALVELKRKVEAALR